MSKIRVLSETTINQIAAGEVVENPASVVKELVENALDAGARDVRVEIRGGGQQLIRVSDDGFGMGADDALLSLERYATSKLRAVDDFLELQTMGFRGEALASIAAISKVTLMTALEKGVGTQVEMEGGKLLQVTPCARSRGTTIEVRSLFYNVPARKKFQKSSAVNAAEITRMMTLLSLAHPEVGFELRQQDKLILQASPTDFTGRALHVLGSEFCNGSFSIEAPGLKGFVGAAFHSRPNRSGQYLFINRRAIFSPLISYAVKDGYGTRLAENRHPLFVLHLEVPPHVIDVNVHPQKKEVRFQQEQEIKERIRSAISVAFQPVTSLPVSPLFEEPLPWDFAAAPLKFKEDMPPQEMELPLAYEMSRFLGLFASFLLLEENAKLLIVDLSAARALLALESLTKKPEKQRLLLPLHLEVTRAEAELLQTHLEVFEKMGFSLHSSGPCHFLVDEIPSFLETEDVLEALMQLVEDENPVNLSRFAKSSKKKFVLPEAIALYHELKKRAPPYMCPQGRPIMVQLSHDEIKKFFACKQVAEIADSMGR